MQIDWVTVAAQIVNFLVLVWLLQHFLYGPVIRAMDRREARIAERLEEARRKAAEAEEEAEHYRRRRAEIEERSEHMLSEAREQAADLRRSLEEDVREDMAETRRAWREQVQSERETFLRDLRSLAARQFYALARRALGDLANARLEDEIAAAFVERLRRLDKTTRRNIAEACSAPGCRLVVRSGFELPAELRRRITRAIHETIAGQLEVDYERSADVVCGVEVRAGAQTVMWSLNSYLDQLEGRLTDALAELAVEEERQPTG